jgi:hypothetical protein
MKTYITLLSIVFSSVATSQMQTPNLEWAFSLGNNYSGNTSPDEGHAICTDAHGNTYTTGYFSAQADFDPGSGTTNLNPSGSYDLFIMKSDAAGNFKWAKSFGSPSIDLGSSLAYDDHGCIYLAGGFAGLVDFDDGPGTTLLNSGSARDIFVQKIDTLGNVIWTRAMTGSSMTLNSVYAMDVNYDLNAVFLSGYFESTVDFDPGASTDERMTNGGKDIFVQKLDMLGNSIWTCTFGNAGNETGYALISDETGNVYVTGEYEGTVDFDPGVGVVEMTSNGAYDSFILKLNSAGELVWVKSVGGTDWDLAESINLDATGNIYVTGSYSATTDFDPGADIAEMTSNSNTDAFILKLNSSGDYVWAKTISNGEDDDYAKSSVIDSDGFIYTTGYFNGTSDFDPGMDVSNLATQGTSDIFVQKMDSMGNFVWAQSFGGQGADWGKSIALDHENNICMTGFFRNTVDFDPWSETSNLVSNEYSNIFVLKLNQDVHYAGISSENEQAEKMMLFPNPADLSTQLLVPDSPNTSVVVYDLSGKVVSAPGIISASEQVKIDLSDLESGTYLVAVTTAAGTQTEKLVIRH